MTEANPALALFTRAVNKRRLSNRIAAVGITLISAVGLAWGLSAPGGRGMSRMAALSGAGLLVGPLVLGLSFRASKGLAALQSPERIVWFYGRTQAQRVTGVVVGTTDGQLHSLPVRSLDEGPEAMALLRQLAGSATEGYSEERRAAFRAQPASLRRPAKAP